MKIELLACVVFFVVAVSSEVPESATVCEPGKDFKKDCNLCRCSTDGKDFACTRKACPGVHTPLNSERRKRNLNKSCVPHSSFKKDCNNCKCNAEGTKAVCTLKKCPGNVKNKRDAGKVCEPNTIFMKDCNICVCNQDGTNGGCTLRACIEYFEH